MMTQDPAKPAEHSKNNDLLQSFVLYCCRHPEYRFWQALRNGCGYSFIVGCDSIPPFGESTWVDTFSLEKRHHND